MGCGASKQCVSCGTSKCVCCCCCWLRGKNTSTVAPEPRAITEKMLTNGLKMLKEAGTTEVTNTTSIIVIDNGSAVCKVGFAGENRPRAEFSSIVGRPKGVMNTNMDAGVKDCYVGKNAEKRKGILINYPIKDGIIENWEEMEMLWRHAFTTLKVDPRGCYVLLTEARSNSEENRRKMAEIMFEKFEVQGIYIATKSMLALFASSHTTGIVLDCGHGVTHAVPIIEGSVQDCATFEVAGLGLDEYFITLVNEVEHRQWDTSSEKMIARKLKEKHCYVAYDYDREKTTAETSTKLQKIDTLPDGKSIILNTECFRCPEVLFEPEPVTDKPGGIHETLLSFVGSKKFDAKKCYANTVLAGGTTMLPGFEKRLKKEISQAHPQLKINILASTDPKNSVWIGGSVLASISAFQSMWISKKEYNDKGDSFSLRRSF